MGEGPETARHCLSRRIGVSRKLKAEGWRDKVGPQCQLLLRSWNWYIFKKKSLNWATVRFMATLERRVWNKTGDTRTKTVKHPILFLNWWNLNRSHFHCRPFFILGLGRQLYCLPIYACIKYAIRQDGFFHMITVLLPVEDRLNGSSWSKIHWRIFGASIQISLNLLSKIFWRFSKKNCGFFKPLEH